MVVIDGGPGVDWRPRSARTARTLLHAVTGDSSLGIHKDPRGKPFVPRRPGGRPVHLSVSHSRHVFALAVGPVPLGLDVEGLRHPTRWRSVYAWITPPAERLPDPDPDTFLRGWTAREAVVKLLGTGLNHGLDTLSLPPDPPSTAPGPPAGSSPFRPVPLDGGPCWITHLAPWRERAVALALESPQPVRSYVVIDALVV
ncbi:4'-phosphopantetheinyl transferase family protein [Roseospira goensis]|uniref:4'-phosphopantetheinyl transferase domain-containing protein n=1 Tax=Roseospira goensis TaxID=391922 RepID=A0A7W6RYQ0_9PROT|nr:4'-phosphopantetheinyl transferase superfamily protein [Roseospira goensis]MBB4285694.1 hypothetical protein [Roseospira goensis]